MNRKTRRALGKRKYKRKPKTPPPADSIVLTIDEAADRLRISRGMIYLLAAAKDLDLVKFGTASRITCASIVRLVAKRTALRGESHPSP